MLPSPVLNALLAMMVLAPALVPMPSLQVAATLAASPTKTSSNADAWADKALADPESDRGWGSPCDHGWNDGREVYCVVREFPYTAGRTPIAIDASQNGGIQVMGWDRPTVRVLYRVKAQAGDRDRAKEIAEAVEVARTGGKLRAEGPRTSGRESWSAEFRVWVPRSSDLWLHSVNGPVGVQGVRGTMDLRTINGPLSLVDLGGAVEARADNGPLHVELTGTRWQGAGLDASTQNGPVDFELPSNYSARLETGTIHGPRSIEYTLTLTRLTRGHMTVTLGSGGPPVRVVTNNGPFQMTAR